MAKWIQALVFLLGPAVALQWFGWVAAYGGPRPRLTTGVALLLISSLVWLGYVGLFPHENPCEELGPMELPVFHNDTDCPTIYGYDALLPDEHAAGTALLFAGFVIPAAWVGWHRLARPATVGAVLVIAPTALAWWTAPRGDGDGLWTFIFWFVAVLGVVAAAVSWGSQRLSDRRAPA